jgi:PAS domain S-box-containing protein
VQDRLRSTLIAYIAAVTATAAAVLLRWLLDPLVHNARPLAAVYGAVAFAVWFGGYRPALLAAVLGYLASDYLFIAPRGTVGFHDVRDLVRLTIFLLSCLIIIGFGEAMRVAQRRAQSIGTAKREGEQRIEAILEQSPVGIGLMDTTGSWLVSNATMRRLAPERVPSRDQGRINRWSAFKSDGSPLEPENWPVARALRGEVVCPGVEFSHTTDDGREIWTRVATGPFRDAPGAVVGAVVIAQDITEWKEAEATAAAVQQQLEIVTDSMSTPVTLCSRDLRFLWVSKSFADWFGPSPDEIVGRPILDVIGPEAFGQLRPRFEQVLAGETVRYEEEVDYRGLGRRWINAIYTPTLDAAGVPDGWVAVVIDITERRRLEESLKQADRRKDEFLATLAHELRNPLAPMRSAVEMMKRSDSNAALIEQGLGLMDRQVGHMVRLIDDLLDISRITAGKLQLRKERLELAALVRSAVQDVRPLIEASAHELTVTLPPEPIHLEADPTRLAQVIANLLVNAAKYTEKGGHIWLTVERQGKGVMMSVRDTGIGISAEHLPHVFEMFSQVVPALERSQGGLGVGLALVKGLVELHGGTVEAHSSGNGMGSVFILRLPIVELAARAAQAPGGDGEKSCRPSTRRILVVDDNRDAAYSTAMVLRLMGHDTQTAHDGLEAVKAAATFRPDVMLLDIGLPRINGYEAARRIRQEPWGKSMALIALTGWGQEEDRQRALEAGCDYHLTKPVEAATLEKLLGTLGPERRA